MIRYRGRYYYMATDDGNGQTTLKIRGSDTISGLAEAEERVIFTANPEDICQAACGRRSPTW